MILEYLLSSKDLYARVVNIIKPNYFDPELRQVFLFVQKYFEKYSTLPKLDKIKAELDQDFTLKTLDKDDINYISEECEKFAKESAIKDAIQMSMQDMVKGNYDKVTTNILEAVKISIDRDVGIDLYDNPEQRLKDCIDSLELIPTNIKALDNILGGCARKQLTLISANSGVGKSVLMSNLGDNYAAAGYHVLYISLELSEDMIFTRLASIATGEDTKTWKQNIPKIASKINDIKEAGAGSYVIKRMKNGSNANDIRAYLKQYQLIFERTPDIIIVDYLDIMTPIGGISGLSISEQDKAKSEQLYEIGVDYDAIMFSASQQNRDGIKQASPDQAVIAGGFAKINIVDNYMSIHMTPAMRLEGIMILYFLKTRSSSGVGDNIVLKFNRDNLQITDNDDEGKMRAMVARLSKATKAISPTKNETSNPSSSYSVMTESIEGLPKDDNDDQSEVVDDNIEDILNFMSFINR